MGKKISKIKKQIRIMVQKSTKLRFAYAWYYKHKKVKPNIILFESFHGSTISDSPFYILKELLASEEKNKFTIYYSTLDAAHDKHNKLFQEMNIPAKLVKINSYKYVRLLATAKYLINNSSFPVYFIRRQEQNYLQTWHGTPLKTLGKQMRLGIESMHNVQHNFLQANYMMHPNEFTKDVIMRDYNLESLYTGKVILNGYPRNTIFLNQEKAETIRKELGLQDKTVYAYMPTWRGASNHTISQQGFANDIKKLFTHLDKNFKDNQILYVNFHPILKDSIKLEGYKHIKEFPTTVENYEFLNSADVLITDYSSVFFDFSITGKPIILYMYDYDEYMSERGMYLDIKSLPFTQIYDMETLTHALVSEKILKASYANDDNYAQYTRYDTKSAARKMLDLVLYDKTDGLEIQDYGHNSMTEHRVIYPRRCINEGDFRSLSKVVKPDDVVLLETRWFTQELSAALYDKYNDCFNYVIMTLQTPETIFEKAAKKLGSQKDIHKLFCRELQRTLPNLKIKGEFIRSYYTMEDGCRCQVSKWKFQQVCGSNKENSFAIYFDRQKGYQYKNFAIMETSGTIIWQRPISEQEISEGVVKEDFEQPFMGQKLTMKQRYLLVFEVYNKTSRESELLLLKDIKNSENIKQNITAFDSSYAYFAPVKLPYIIEEGRNSALMDAIVLPYQRLDDYAFSLYVCTPQAVQNEMVKAFVTHMYHEKSKAVYLLKVSSRNIEIVDVVLSYRTDSRYNQSLTYSVEEKERLWCIRVEIDFPKLDLKVLYWDLDVIVRKGEEEHSLLVRGISKKLKIKLYFLNCEYEVNEENVIFPYFREEMRLSFFYRMKSEYDGYNVKIRELISLVVNKICYSYLKKKEIWLVFEKFCSMAQDNGYYFFKYCMDNLSEEDKKNIFFVIDKRSPDYENVRQYDKHIIQFMSLRHCIYLLAASIYIGSDSKTHLYAWRTKPSIIKRKLNRKPIYFLQHGVTALKKVDYLFGKKGSSPMTYFATTSEFEQKIVIENFGYLERNAPITGFTRWDVLCDKQEAKKHNILIMPTWRSWLEDASNEAFLNSDYYNNYTKLLSSKRLHRLLKEQQVELIFYLHPKFAGYLNNFKCEYSRIKFIPFGQEPLNELIMKCSMMITDYSSVCWEAYYLAKPVIFYQFDNDKYDRVHGSYIDKETELFGRRGTDLEGLLDQLEDCISHGFCETQKDIEDRGRYFKYIDNDNSRRTYEFLIDHKY